MIPGHEGLRYTVFLFNDFDVLQDGNVAPCLIVASVGLGVWCVSYQDSFNQPLIDFWVVTFLDQDKHMMAKFSQVCEVQPLSGPQLMQCFLIKCLCLCATSGSMLFGPHSA